MYCQLITMGLSVFFPDVFSFSIVCDNAKSHEPYVPTSTVTGSRHRHNDSSSSRWESTPSTPSKCPERISYEAERSMENSHRASHESYYAYEFPNRPSSPPTTSNKRTHSRWESLPIENSVRSMSPPHRPHSSPPVSPRS